MIIVEYVVFILIKFFFVVIVEYLSRLMGYIKKNYYGNKERFFFIEVGGRRVKYEKFS